METQQIDLEVFIQASKGIDPCQQSFNAVHSEKLNPVSELKIIISNAMDCIIYED